MEPVAVNHIRITEELFAESHAAVFSERRRKMLLYAGIVFFAFGIMLLFTQIRIGISPLLSLPALLTGAFVIWRAATLRQADLKKRYAAFRKRNGDAQERTITCYSRYLTVENGGEEPVYIDYPDITQHLETEHLLLLICGDHTGIQLAKDGFSSGSAGALLEAVEKAREETEITV